MGVGKDTIEVTNGDLTAIVQVTVTEVTAWSKQVSIDMNFPAGWSMISLPVKPESYVLKDLFPDALAVFGFFNKYVLIDPNAELETGEGYWIYSPNASSSLIYGEPIDNYINPNAPSGWSMIGAGSYPAKPSVDNGSIQAIFGFENKYVLLDPNNPLEPGNGYWINLSEEAELTVQR